MQYAANSKLRKKNYTQPTHKVTQPIIIWNLRINNSKTTILDSLRKLSWTIVVKHLRLSEIAFLDFIR